MRHAILLGPVVLGLVLSACGTAPVTSTPREYQDEQTAATVKVVAEPLVFAEESSPSTARDYLNIYAIDVNRMGAHQQYLAVLQWWPAEKTERSMLLLEAPGQSLALRPIAQSPRDLGISRPVDAAAPRNGLWRYYAVTKEQLGILAQAANVRATLVSGEQKVAYALWRDSRMDVAELADGIE